METNANNGANSPLELMLKWNRFCDANGREGDCILLSEPRTFVEAFANEEEAMREIINSQSPEFKRDEGFLISVYDGERYKGMEYVPKDEIARWIELDKIR